MEMFEPKRKEVYKCRDFSFMVIASSPYDKKMSIVKIRREKQTNFPELRVDTLGVADVGMPETWSVISMKYKYNPVFLFVMSDRKFNQILNIQDQIFSGKIVYDKIGNLIYEDEIEDDIQEANTFNDVSDEEESFEDEDFSDSEDDESEEEPEDHSKEESSKREVHYLNGSHCSTKASSNTGNTYKNKVDGTYERVKSKDSVFDRGYTDEEIIFIAESPTAAISQRFSIELSSAINLKYAAKNYLGLEEKKQRNNKYCIYFEKGYSVDDVVKIFGEGNRHNIYNTFKYWEIYNKSSKNNNKAVISRYENLDEVFKTKKEMADFLLSNTEMKFAEENECTIKTAKNILNRIKTVLYKNPYFLVFEDSRFFEDGFDPRSDDRYTDLDKRLIDVVDSVKSEYVSTYDSHTSMIDTTKIDFLSNMIRKRFNMRTVTKSDLGLVLKNDTWGIMFLRCVCEKSANTFIRNHKTKAKVENNEAE